MDSQTDGQTESNAKKSALAQEGRMRPTEHVTTYRYCLSKGSANILTHIFREVSKVQIWDVN